MRTPVEILKEQREISGQIDALTAEIIEKESKLDRLKKLNLQLLTKNLAKERRPVSLRTQNEKLKNFEVEICQLRDVIPILEARQAELEDELVVAMASEELEGYYEKSQLFFGKVEEGIQLLENAVDLTEKLEMIVAEIRESNPLYELSDIFGGLDTLAQFDALGFPDELRRYRFLTELVSLEKQVNRLPSVVKGFSDFAFGLEYTGLKNLKIPTEKGNQGPTYTGGGGPRTKVEREEAPEIERHPEKYTEADVRKYGIQAVNRR